MHLSPTRGINEEAELRLKFQTEGSSSVKHGEAKGIDVSLMVSIFSAVF